jgi:hypothetical protein
MNNHRQDFVKKKFKVSLDTLSERKHQVIQHFGDRRSWCERRHGWSRCGRSVVPCCRRNLTTPCRLYFPNLNETLDSVPMQNNAGHGRHQPGDACHCPDHRPESRYSLIICASVVSHVAHLLNQDGREVGLSYSMCKARAAAIGAITSQRKIRRPAFPRNY